MFVKVMAQEQRHSNILKFNYRVAELFPSLTFYDHINRAPVGCSHEDYEADSKKVSLGNPKSSRRMKIRHKRI